MLLQKKKEVETKAAQLRVHNNKEDNINEAKQRVLAIKEEEIKAQDMITEK